MRTISIAIAAAMALSTTTGCAKDAKASGAPKYAPRVWNSCLEANVAPSEKQTLKCYRGDAGEYLFRLPAELERHSDVAAQVERVNLELSEGMDMTARQDRDDAKAGGLAFKPWQVDLHWEISGINNRVASMIATGTLSPRPSRKPNAASHQSAIAMLINRRTGALLTDASDAFSDQMESARSTYCAHLDIQRIANALDADPSAGSAGKPRILDEKGRYLGKWHCPYFGDLAVGFSGPVDQPLDHIVLLAEPGIAGPEHEGYYRVQLAITPTMLANVRPEYRDAFRATNTCKDCDVEKHEQ